MAHRSGETAAEPELRAFLFADRIEFRNRMCSTLAENGRWSREAWRQLSPSVNVLAAGEPYRFSGYQLPDGHPMRGVVGPHADLVLGRDDVLGGR